MLLLTRGPWPWSEREAGVDRPNPATAIAGGEGGGAWEREEVKAHLTVCLDESGMVGGGGSAASRAAAAEVQWRGGCSGEFWSMRSSPLAARG